VLEHILFYLIKKLTVTVGASRLKLQ